MIRRYSGRLTLDIMARGHSQRKKNVFNVRIRPGGCECSTPCGEQVLEVTLPASFGHTAPETFDAVAKSALKISTCDRTRRPALPVLELGERDETGAWLVSRSPEEDDG